MKPAMAPRQRRRVTGRAITITFVVFFGIVVGVNLLMARLAISTFGGTVVDNSYVASQQYNQWLEQDRAQARLGWGVVVDVADDRRVTVSATDAAGAPLTGAMVRAMAEHPLGRADPVPLTFVRQDAPGGAASWRSRQPLPPGRWRMRVTVTKDDRVHRSIKDAP